MAELCESAHAGKEIGIGPSIKSVEAELEADGWASIDSQRHQDAKLDENFEVLERVDQGWAVNAALGVSKSSMDSLTSCNILSTPPYFTIFLSNFFHSLKDRISAHCQPQDEKSPA